MLSVRNSLRTPIVLLILCGTLPFQTGVTARGAELKVTGLRCEYAQNPLGVDTSQPRLFWQLESSAPGQRQTGRRILVASSLDLLKRETGDLWDSGIVESDATTQVSYGGKPLNSFQQVFWKVRAWDMNAQPTAWSEPATWTVGVLDRADWHAAWIGSPETPAPSSLYLRGEIQVRPRLKRALAYVCGLGCYEFSINGRKAGDFLFPPGWTKYDKTCLYDTYDVTDCLRRGTNALGLLLGNGMYNVERGRYTKFTGSFGALKAIAVVRLEYSDGAVEYFGTGEHWRAHPGPLTFNSVYGGEDYDARLQCRGWDRRDFNAEDWVPASVMNGPGGQLHGLTCAAPPVREFETLLPVRVTDINSRTKVYDLGVNASIMPHLRVKGPTGSVVRIIPAELLADNGTVDRTSCGGGRAYWQYTLDGMGSELWVPRFFYHGSRYLQVECQPASGAQKLPRVVSLKAVVVQSSSETVGDFACSNPLFNRIYNLVRRAQRSNLMSVLTDCPHRERLGWLEQDHLNGPSLRYGFDLARLFAKALNDMSDSQLANGLVPDIAPEYVQFEGGFRDSPEWGSACILVAWQQYEFEGDIRLLRQHYPMMKRYVDYLRSRAKDGLLNYGLGDWYDIGPKPPGVAQLTPIALTASAFYFDDARLVSRIAEILGKTEDATEYAAQAKAIRSRFNEEFFDGAKCQYATGSQCANALPLVIGLVDETNRSAVLSNLVADVQTRGNALTAGDVGYRYLLRALAEGGRSDVIFAINNQTNKPGYGYQLAKGATSLTEAWDADRHSSQNHFMLGQIVEWFYHDVAGIAIDPKAPGFKNVIIRPTPVGELRWAKAHYISPHGMIECDWKREGHEFVLKVKIPPGGTGTVYVPTGSSGQVTVNGRPAGQNQGVQFLHRVADTMVYQVPSGSYEFRS